MKKGTKIILALLAVLCIVGAVKFFTLSNLSLEGYEYPNAPEKGRQLLAEMGVAHKIHLWDSASTYNVIFEDEFYGFLGSQAHPFSEDKVQFSMNYVPKSGDGQLEIITGEEKGKFWGIQSWRTYHKDDNENFIEEKNDDINFWLPTYQYFIEFPSRIQEATAVDYMGSKTINGVACEGIIASWGTVEPQSNIDQYVVWIDAKSKMIVKIEYTIRDAYNFIAGAAYFEDYQNFCGMPLARSFPVESNLLREGFLHKMSIKKITPNILTLKEIRPLEN